MKTKNVKVRLKDIKQGVTVYVAHPVYGIEKLLVDSKPYMHPTVKSLFIRTVTKYGKSTNSLRDMGVYDSYNGRRTFFKLKQAEEWMRKWSKSKSFIADHKLHEEWCRVHDEWWFDDQWFDDQWFEVGQEVIWTDFDGDFGDMGCEYPSVITGVRDSTSEQGYDCYYLELCNGVRIEALDHEIKAS